MDRITAERRLAISKKAFAAEQEARKQILATMPDDERLSLIRQYTPLVYVAKDIWGQGNSITDEQMKDLWELQDLLGLSEQDITVGNLVDLLVLALDQYQAPVDSAN